MLPLKLYTSDKHYFPLPEHSCKLQCSISSDSPRFCWMHVKPPNAGAGLEQARDLDFVPLPHVWSQLVHVVHWE